MVRTHIFALIAFLVFSIASSAPSCVYIVIHGTWAANQTWHKPGGNFFDALQKSAHACSGTTTFFAWSGKADAKSRLQAGKDLAQVIRTYDPATPLCLIAHSHGANVGIIACQELAQQIGNRHTIKKFFALGMPVNIKHYLPDMSIITHFYNFFSLHDYVQPVLGLYGRLFPEHPRIANIRVTLEGQTVSHSQLHHPCIAQWIPYIHEQLALYKESNFEQFAFGKPGALCFFNEGIPLYYHDVHQKRLLALDRAAQRKVGVEKRA